MSGAASQTMGMDVLFVMTQDKCLHTPEQMHFGISYISAVLKSHGHRTHLLVLDGAVSRRAIRRAIVSLRPRLVCFTTVASQYATTLRVSRWVRAEAPTVYQLVGGAHVALNPAAALDDGFDAVCVGEGEYATLELVRALERGSTPSGIANLWIRHGDATERNPPRSRIEDLDRLPWPDREMWQPWFSAPDETQVVLLSRGCPYDCSYCSNHALRLLAPGRYVRFRSPTSVLAEAHWLAHRFPRMSELNLQTETIGADLPFAFELADRLLPFHHAHPHVRLSTNLRVMRNYDHEPLIAALAKVGLRRVDIGLESGNERVRGLLRRQYSNHELMACVQAARRHGVHVKLYVMMGLPGETFEEFQDTLECCRQVQPDVISYWVFYPYPGTDAYAEAMAHSVVGRGHAAERTRAAAAWPGFPRREVDRQFTWFYYHVYRGHRPLRDLLVHTIANRLKDVGWVSRAYWGLHRFDPARRALGATGMRYQR